MLYGPCTCTVYANAGGIFVFVSNVLVDQVLLHLLLCPFILPGAVHVVTQGTSILRQAQLSIENLSDVAILTHIFV